MLISIEAFCSSKRRSSRRGPWFVVLAGGWLKLLGWGLAGEQDPKRKDPVIIAGKDAGEVDNDYFLIPVKILDHEGPLKTTFPIENRLLPQGEMPLGYRPHLLFLHQFLLFLACVVSSLYSCLFNIFSRFQISRLREDMFSLLSLSFQSCA